MHIVTFYSFKGGVGRTMALINAAVDLTQRRKRVLLVDFDLEAPGIQTYDPFVSGQKSLGLVDYVANYLQTGSAPDVASYIAEHRVNDSPIWLMSAGMQNSTYARRLNSIDWLTLYKDFEGYLMFEDLKEQWRSKFRFDYVLIDSRTGHTDVGGICTRQLPDANVLMFFPNDQNIAGLEQVVRNIRFEGKALRKKDIPLHFCPSNIPELDDEDQVLSRHLQQASEKLDYTEPAAIINHYNSLDLLDQKIFVKDRPRTRLADQYRQLVDAIITENLEDKQGALSKLEKIRSRARSSRYAQDIPDLEKTMERIYSHHKEDGEIAWSLSQVYDLLGNIEAQVDTLGIAINKHFNEPRARTKRAFLLSRSSQNDLARQDLRSVVTSSDVSTREFLNAVERLREIDSDWLGAVQKAPILTTLSEEKLDAIAGSLLLDRQAARFVLELLRDRKHIEPSLQLIDPEGHERITDLMLAAIAAGDFDFAMRVLGSRSAALQSTSIAHVFNFACAEWGQRGAASKDLFARVLELAEKEKEDRGGPNFAQCLAMTKYLLADFSNAAKLLRQARKNLLSMPPVPIFSCWRYLTVKREMLIDLDEMRFQMNGRMPLMPRFITELAPKALLEAETS